MKKIILIFTALLLLSFNYALQYKYASSKPVEIVYIKNLRNLSYSPYIDDKALTIFYIPLPDYVLEDWYKKVEDGVYEIKENKLIFNFKPNLSEKKTLDIIGRYIKAHGGTFVYIDKAPAGYKGVLGTGVILSGLEISDNGDYGLDVAKRKLRVNYNEIDKIKALKVSKALGINISYIVTGDSGVKLVKETFPNPSEIGEIIGVYWFPYRGDNYTHLQYKPDELINLIKKIYLATDDIVGLSYYPIPHLDKAPYTFRNDPIGYYYPKVIHYNPSIKDWEEGLESENKYYHAVSDEPYWDEKYEEVSKWYYEGNPVPLVNESKMWERYKYFSDWYVKNYAYLLAIGCDALYLESSDKYLLNLILGRADSDSKIVNIKNLTSYLIVPGERGFKIEDGVPIITFPSLWNESYGATVINDVYIKPDDDFGVYVAKLSSYNTMFIYKLKREGIKVMSFKELANWLERYYRNSVYLKNNTIELKDYKGFKVVIYTNKKIKEVYPENSTIIYLKDKIIVENAKKIVLS
ncbi:conserved hypothetical protein [Methanocaldococcus infernus ME]|uniref:Uncharacterized protein n=1 Tax=Methanocaldococcus infernus (strain DSM 11812 / JCM 15783 / ME) TaxID=573063 RepID=D5VQN3_METIM|nr:hypothetical protein [Methanocaldococcus infernus]ADG12886.1 conserved hypothetical protein [Methanocaldococcus infernus ME]